MIQPVAAGSIPCPAERLITWGTACLRAAGVAEGDARLVADSLVQTNLWGIDSHGIARLTLSTGVPVLPVAVWGSQHVWQRDGARSLKFGRPIWVKAGTPIDFSDYSEGSHDEKTLRTVTEQIMAELALLVDDMRSRYPKRWQ